jgi:hypothetical protein
VIAHQRWNVTKDVFLPTASDALRKPKMARFEQRLKSAKRTQFDRQVAVSGLPLCDAHSCAGAREGCSTTPKAIAAISNAKVRGANTGDVPRAVSEGMNNSDCHHYWPACHPETGRFCRASCQYLRRL